MTNASTGANYYYLADGLGSITQMQGQSKAVVESYIYDSFGNPTIKDTTGTTITQSAIHNPYMFTAREWDGETGLYFYRARYYDAGVGRFLSEDPILQIFRFYQTFIDLRLKFVKRPQNYNQYIYVLNNPMNLIDPTGLACGPEGWLDAIVPDKIFWSDFTPACTFHDSCWGICHKDAGRSESAHKDFCDNNFYYMMENVCNNSIRNNWSLCVGAAIQYHDAVRGSIGQRIYKGAQKKACKCKK